MKIRDGGVPGEEDIGKMLVMRWYPKCIQNIAHTIIHVLMVVSAMPQLARPLALIVRREEEGTF